MCDRDVAPLGAQGHCGKIERTVHLHPGDVGPVRSGHDVKTTMILVDGREAHPDREATAEHGVPAAITVLVPGQADQSIDGVDALEESFGRHVGEVLAEWIAGSVTVAEQVAD